MALLKALTYLNVAIVVIMTAAYFYQIVYTVVGLIFRKAKPEPAPSKLHRFAALICARNEAGVIGELVESLKHQNYPSELLDIYVLADNCTDDTALRADAAGAIVYERSDRAKVGKGYALDYLLKRIRNERGAGTYDAYFILDADNIADAQFVSEMNKTFDRGFDVVTCYRNSKNFGTNWISAGYSIWFLREARFLNYPRMLLGTGCAVSGTGFLVSDRLITENNGWPFHLLTEDIQFSVNCAITGRRIGYCDRAMVYDEQPTSFSQSWKQRLRWSKGFYQVDARYLPRLITGLFTRKGGRMACYDMLMTVAPCMLLTILIGAFNLFVCFAFVTEPHFIAVIIVHKALRYLIFAVVNAYLGFFAYGLLTVVSEWKRINVSPAKKLMYIWAFPIFIGTYIPISLAALGQKVEWTPIEHYSTRDLVVSAAGRRS